TELHKFYDGAIKLDEGAIKLQDGAIKLQDGVLKYETDLLKLDSAPTGYKEALALKLDGLQKLGLKLDGLDANLVKDSAGLQTEYLKLVDEFKSVQPPTTNPT